MNDQGMLKPALIGGVLFGVLSAIPIISAFNCLCCAWVIGGGALAAYLFVKDSPVPVTLGKGALLGLLTGVIGTVAYGLVSLPIQILISRSGAGVLDQMNKVFDQIPDMPPESRRMLESMFSPENAIMFFFVGLIFSLIIYCLFCMLGGTIGVAIFEKRKPGAAPPADASPYQPPSNLPPPPPPPPPVDTP